MLAPSQEVRTEDKTRPDDFYTSPNAVVYIFGVIDSLVPFSYILNVYPDYWHAATLAIKLALCLVYYRYISISRIAVMSALVLTSIILISSVPGGSQFSDYVKIFGFMTHVFITLTMVRRDNLQKYVLTCVGVLFASTLIYLLAAKTGHIDITYGRYSYFHHSHPNLGSEIIAMSVVLAACVLSWPLFLVVTLPSLYAIYLMEGRAAFVVAVITIGAKLVYEEWNNKKRLALILGGLACAGAALLLLSNKAAALLNSILLLHDKYRGLGSGFVGRDQLWSVAWHWFLASPIIGNGAGFFDRYGVEIHNFFLFGLSEFGILSLVIYGMIFFLLYDLYRTNRKWFFCFLGIPVFWMFNDRFFNINPYPFLFYIVLFAHANTAAAGWQPALLMRKAKPPVNPAS
ncbi:MAG: hypothetical protein AB1508_11010 [Pseudomonadota bacterium]